MSHRTIDVIKRIAACALRMPVFAVVFAVFASGCGDGDPVALLGKGGTQPGSHVSGGNTCQSACTHAKAVCPHIEVSAEECTQQCESRGSSQAVIDCAANLSAGPECVNQAENCG